MAGFGSLKGWGLFAHAADLLMASRRLGSAQFGRCSRRSVPGIGVWSGVNALGKRELVDLILLHRFFGTVSFGRRFCQDIAICHFLSSTFDLWAD